MSERVLQQAEALGVVATYKDQTGQLRHTSVETAKALMAAMGVSDPSEADKVLSDLPTDVICEVDSPPPLVLKTPWVLTLEDGTQTTGTGPLPGLPLGIHTLVSGGESYTLLSAPRALPLPPKSWGMVVPLYGLSETGIGTYDQLGQLAADLAPKGASFLGLNPVHAGFPSAPEVFSPYTPSHRRRLNVIHLAGDAGTPGPLVDYPADVPTRLAALKAEFLAAPFDESFESWQKSEGDRLQRFALHQALSFRHGPFWDSWPIALQDPTSPETKATAQELAEEVRFHAWLQWRAEHALMAAQTEAQSAGMRFGLYLDLAVGTHPYGAETWEDRDSFAFGASLGAPPDAFAADGQNWNLAPFNPLALRARAYAPLAETLRRQMQLAGLLRIDHILGFERAFWVPEGAPGAYVTMPRDAMLAVVRIEAARAQATVVGEDLGNIPDGLRGSLEASGVLGCRVMMFERTSWEPPVFREPKDYDAAAMTSFSTHDLPTWQGWRDGRDIDERARLGSLDAKAQAQETKHRKTEVSALDDLLPAPTLAAMHTALAQSHSRLVAVQAENALHMADQPNLPGTIDEFPNWRQRLPVTAQALGRHETVTHIAQIMRNNGR